MNGTRGNNSGDGQSFFPAWLIRSKIQPTRQHVNIVERPELVQKLDACLDATVSLVHAPAGYGKSTLYADWRDSLLKRKIKVCWLSLDKEDNDLFQLLMYIAFSLVESGANFRDVGIKNNAHLGDMSYNNLLSVICRLIEVQQEKVVLIFDNFENLHEESIDQIIHPLLMYAPNNLHIAIASRDDSGLQISHLEIKGLAIRIPAEEMKFKRSDIQTLFPDNMPPNSIESIFRITEGWPMAVQMLSSLAAMHSNIDHLLSPLSNFSGVITAYLSEQIFNKLDLDLQAFLIDISPVDHISCDLGNFLRQRDDSTNWFAACKQLNTLVLPLEQEEHTYRLHPLFREHLYRSLLCVNHPGRAVELHLRAAEWFATKGNIVVAISHVVKAKQPSRSVDILDISGGGFMIWLREGLARLRTVLGLLDEETIIESPRLTLLRCLIDIKDGRVYEARRSYDAMMAQYRQQKRTFSSSARGKIEHERMLFEILLACYEGKMLSEKSCHQLIESIQEIAPNEHATLGHHYSVLCFANTQRGRLEQARSYAELAVEEFRLLGSIYGEVYIYFHLGDICFAEGSSEQAQQHYHSALRLARRHLSDDKGIRLVAQVLIAELKYELNDTRSLPHLLASVPRQLEEREAWFDIYAAGYTTASNFEFDRYGLDAAIIILDKACVYADAQKLTHLINLLTFQRIDLLLRAGLQDQAKEVLKLSGLQMKTYKNSGSNEFAWRECHAAVHAMTWLAIHQGQYDRAISALSDFSLYAENHGHNKSCTRYEILRYLANYRNGDKQQSFYHLNRALSWSSRSGFIRSFIDIGIDIQEALHYYLRSDEAKRSKNNHRQAEKILSYFDDTESEEVIEQLLSNREFEILGHLVRGESNKVIARSIDISENTVRFHLKNIFAKLNVRSRLQAVTVAHQKNII